MQGVNERIALLEREYRKQKRQEAEKTETGQSVKQEQTGQLEETLKHQRKEITLENVLIAVRTGEVCLWGKQYLIERDYPEEKNFPEEDQGAKECYSLEVKSYFEDKIPMVLLKDVYTGRKEEEQAVILVNHQQNISQVLTLADSRMGEESLDSWKKKLETGMKLVGTYVEVTQETSLEHLDYLIYRTPTGKGWIYSLLFRIHTGSGRAVGNYNCMEKDKKTYGILLEALLYRMNELLSEQEG